MICFITDLLQSMYGKQQKNKAADLVVELEIGIWDD